MPLPTITDVFRVTLNWTHPTLPPAHNVMHLLAPTSTATDVYTDLNANVTANMWIAQLNNASVSSVDILELDGASATQTFSTGSPAKWTGQQATEALVATCPIVSLRTTQRGPARRGRLYLPMLAEGSQASGALTAGVVSTAQAAWTAFLAAMETAGSRLVVASYVHADSVNVSTVIYEPLCGTQRRRQDTLRRG